MRALRNARSLGATLAWVAALAMPVAFGAACGARHPATSPTGASSTAASDTEIPEADRPRTDTVTSEAPPPPPAPGEASKLSNEDVRKAYAQGVDQYRRGDLVGAQQSFQSAISMDSKAWEAHYALGLTLEHLGKTSDALDQYREAYKLDPNYESAITAYGYLLYRSGSRAEAERFLTDQNAKAPKAFGIMTALAEIKSLNGDSDTAQSLAQNALTLEGKYEPAMVLIARDHYRKGRIALAQYVLSAILDGQQTDEERAKGEPAKKNPPRAPGNAEAQMLRAIILQKAGERQAATIWYEKATRARPDLVEAHLQLGLLRIESNDAEGARAPLEMAVRYAPSNAEARLALGEAYRLQPVTSFDGELGWQRARKEYDWVLASPGSSSLVKALAQYDLGLLYFLVPGVDKLADVPRFDKAIDFFNQYKSAKGTTQGPAWPSDVDDLLVQAQTARRNAQAAAAGAGGTTPKGGATPPPKPAPAAPTATAKPAAPAASNTAAPAKTTAPAPASSGPSMKDKF